MKDLPIYEIKVDEEDGAFVNAVALVKRPAIEKNFLSFNEHLNFSVNEEKRELLGLALIPNMKIYRRDGDKEFNVFFSKETIREIAQVFFKKNLTGNLNLFHTTKSAECYIYQSFITDDKLGIKAPQSFGDVPDGSWIIGVKVNNEHVWKSIKEGKIKGFSVEGLFQLVKGTEMEKTTDLLKELKALLN